MHEILFRGKRFDNSRWVYGYLSFIYVDGKNQDGFIYTNKARIYSQEDCRSYDVLTETVGQSTGLCDKNGKKIFEGDIVGFEDGMSTESGYAESGCTGRVYWDKETASFQVDNRLCAESYEVLNECTIIGNIHDNPELLEGK